MRERALPWAVAGAALLMLMISNGLVVTGITAFDEALLAEFGWSRGALKFRDLLTLLLAGAFAPFVGILIDRLGVRPLMIAGGLLLAASYLAYSAIASLGHVYAIHLVFGLVLTACGLNVAVIWVSQWFVRHRGTAIGLALVGTSLGGMLFPPLIVALMQAQGWRSSFAWLALTPAAHRPPRPSARTDARPPSACRRSAPTIRRRRAGASPTRRATSPTARRCAR
ncbi:MAG: MFS transporter [Xanthomonadales bacterium]|nr:MFS transporter [Xanthomonadales bacterium]